MFEIKTHQLKYIRANSNINSKQLRSAGLNDNQYFNNCFAAIFAWVYH